MRDLGLVGGIPSSGSTLLMRLLSDRPGLVCLPETGLFAHGRNLLDFNGPEPAADLSLAVPWLDSAARSRQALGLTAEQWREIRSGYNDALGFAEARLAVPGCLLVEKTPENVFGFGTLLDHFPEMRVVVTTRDALGTAQSLMRRGFSLLDACLVWFGHAWAAVHALQAYPEQVFHCRYADLTRDPEGTTAAVAAHLFAGRQFAGEPGRGGEAIEGSARTLEATAWTRSVAGPVVAREPVNWLGNRFRVLFERTVFTVAPDRYVHGRDVERFLDGKTESVEPFVDERMRPVPHEPGSAMARILLSAHGPCRVGG